MSNTDNNIIYNKEKAESYDTERFVSNSGQKIHDTEFRILNTALTYIPVGSKILEVGCGTGRFLLETSMLGYSVDGIDASPYMLKQCKIKIKTLSPKPKLILGEAAKLPCPDNSYDFVYCIRLLNQTESVEYALNVVTDMIRVAKYNGYILIEFVNHYRPRLGSYNTRGIHLRPAEVIERANQHGAIQIWCHGAFFLSMTSFHVTPDSLLHFISTIDRGFSWLLPRLCSRCYILFRKK
jgi:ubiquinone/menaquinone biosynthesis C-methylase UbiE